MRVEVYAVCYNEEETIKFFIKHYSWAWRIFIFDNHSTDNSRKIASSMGAIVRTFGNKNLDDREYLKIKNEMYKGSKADYVIMCDLDEYLYHPTIVQHLIRLKREGVTMPRVTGYNVYSNDMPRNNMLEIQTGYRYPNFDKQAIFDPKVNINYIFGCHKNKATGHIVRGGDIKLLHYRCIGGVQRMIDRHRAYAERMCDFNRRRNLGGHYFRKAETLKKEWSENMNKSKKLLFLSNVQSYNT